MKTFGLILLAMAGSYSILTAQDSSRVAVEDSLAQSEYVGDASAVALAWLVMVDSGEYAESWTGTAEIFKLAVTKSDWVNQLTSVRTPIGAVVTRSFAGGKYTTSLPQAPDGEYVVLQYKTVFESGGSMTETITPMKDPDGLWRVAGYYIAP